MIQITEKDNALLLPSSHTKMPGVSTEMPIRIFTFGVLPTFPEVGQRVCSLLSSPSDSLEPHGTNNESDLF